MIHPLTEIMVLDIESGDPITNITIKDLYAKMYGKVNQVDENVSVIYPENLMIQDWTGWSHIQTIRRITNPNVTWYAVTSTTDPRKQTEVIVSKETLLPMYDPNLSKQGFNGEIKFKYQLKNPEKITSDDTIRVRDESMRIPDFQFVEVSQYEDEKTNWGFEIVTKSSFFNGDGVHLYGADYGPISSEGFGMGYK